MALKKLVSDLTQGLVAYPNSNTPADSGGFNYGRSTSIFDTKVFNQRSIPYSQPLSRQNNPEPLIPQILPGVNQEPNESSIFITDSPDGFIRGGETNAIKRAAVDSIRINKFFISGEGISFISNQRALQKSNPVIQEGGGNLNNTLEDALNQTLGTNFTTANTNRTFNEENLIKQISEGGYTGNYYNRAGSNPSIQSEVQNKYEAVHKPGRKFDANVMGEFNAMGGLVSGNRLITLGKKLNVGIGNSFVIGGPSESLLKQAGFPFDVGELINGFNDIKTRLNAFLENPLESLSKPGPYSQNKEIGFKPGEDIIYQYSGGPGSTYGIGDTILYRYERTSGDFDHQGHPLSISKYFESSIETVGSPTQYNFYNDGEFDQNQGLQFLTDIANENLFGGNQILGTGVFRNEEGRLDGNLLIEGLGRQILGQDNVNFINNLAETLGFSGAGTPNPEDEGKTIVVADGNYILGEIAVSAIRPESQKATEKIYLDGKPKAGFITHGFTSNEGRGAKFKPDSVAEAIEKDKTSELPGDVGKKSPFIITNINTSYKPNFTGLLNDNNLDHKKLQKYDNSDLGLLSAMGENIKVAANPAGKGSGFNIKEEGNYRRESRIGTGDPGATWEDQSIGIDRINALDIQENESTFNHPKYRDLVRFRFEAIRTNNPSNVDVMAFRAFLDDFGDSYTGNWNSFKYNGRGEEFFTYQGFKRTFNISFKIAAQSREEMKPLYRKLNYLVSNTAPDYSSDGRMRGPLMRLCVGAYMDRTPGFINSINIKWQKDYPFEIAISNPEGKEDRDMHVLPHVLDVQCQFTPIHDFVPRKSIEESPFIIPGVNSFLHTSNTDRKWLSGKDDTTDTTSSTSETVTDEGKQAIYKAIAVKVKLFSYDGEKPQVLILNSLDKANNLSLRALRKEITKIAGIPVFLDQANNLDDKFTRNISREVFGDANSDGINDFKVNITRDKDRSNTT